MGVISPKPWKKTSRSNSHTDLSVSYGRHPPVRSFSASDLRKPIGGNGVRATIGTIQICSGDITKQYVDAIVISSTSDNLRDYVLKEAGDSIRQAYDNERKCQPSKSICTNGGNLACKRIYFIPCPQLLTIPSKWTFRNFVKEAIRLATSDHSIRIRSLALPAIGCGLSGCDSNFVANTLLMAVAYEFQHQPSLRFEVYFVIRRSEQNIFDAFRTGLTKLENPGLHAPPPAITPPPYHKSTGFSIEKRLLERYSEGYRATMKEFTSTMTASHYSTILRIELVWNERWYKQYMIHKEAFFQRLQQDTERLLFHGCPEEAANSIIKDCFNRRCCGINGVAYGQGAYFSSRANYSHSYTTPNTQGERCMFLAKVLVGKSILGNSSMKVCPSGYDTTTDGSHIFVVYHDAQAFGNYLITYK